MGLDMYLEKRTYVKNWDYMQPAERTTVTVTQNGKPVPGIDPAKVKYIIEEAGYWRKANQIHAWFVEYVQSGTDDCGDYYVSREQLKELLDTVNTVLAASELVEGDVHTGTTWNTDAQELLPTQSGFFFEGIDYDQYYFEDLQETKRILEAALRDETGDYYYHSSW